MVKLQQVKDRYSVAVPKEYVEQAKLEKGEVLTWSFNERGKGIIILFKGLMNMIEETEVFPP